MKLVTDFLLVFTPLFFAIDSIGMLPIFVSMTSDLETIERRKLTRDAVLTALGMSILFLFAGKVVFKLFGITENDFRIGGGILLFVIAMSDLIFAQQEKRRAPLKERAIVPIGMPLIIGPASLTTILILSDKFGHISTLLSIVVNLFLAWLIFRHSEWIIKFLGKGFTLAIGKIFSLFLLAIAVMMVRIGITNFIH